MPEETATPEVEEKSPDTPEAPVEKTTSDEESFTDSFKPEDLPEEARAAYESAYKEMQSDYTRKTQSLAEQRQEAEQWQQIGSALRDPEYRDEALRVLGVELPEQQDTDDDEYLDDTERLQAELEEVRQYLAQSQEEQQLATYQDQEMDFLADKVEALEKDEGGEFDESEVNFLVAFATANRKPNGEPDVEAANEVLNSASKVRQKRYVESKKSPSMGAGSAGQKAIDLKDDDARLSAMTEAFESTQGS